MKRKRRTALVALAAMLLILGITLQAASRQKKLRTPPKPQNKEVKYEAYEGTDIAQLVYKTSRKEFRVGHSPYLGVRFYVAEYVLISEHVNRYTRPDYKAEIKMAPGRTKPALMANKTFQDRWKNLVASQEKLLSRLEKMVYPKECKQAYDTFVGALLDDLFLAKKVSERMFTSQEIRSRERLREELKERFRSRDTDWYDRMMDDFEDTADLSKFYPRFVDLMIKPRFTEAEEHAMQAMAKVGVEYATAVEEEGDITAP